MVVVITPEADLANEVTLVHQLFEAGLQVLHLRKPSKSIEEYRSYLDQIDQKYHPRIVVHFYHELVNSYSLKGIHFQEQKRIDHIDHPGQYFLNLDMYGKTISSSFHDPKELENCEFEFDYHLLSPVFSSISKKGYEGKGFNVATIDKLIIGMGGVTSTNLAEFIKLGYKGVAALGGIWNSDTPVSDFMKIKNEFEVVMTN